MSDDMGDDWAGAPDPDRTDDGAEPAPLNRQGPVSIDGHPGWVVGDFANGKGLLGVRWAPQPDPLLHPVASLSLSPSGASSGPVKTATTAVNGVPMAIYQPQPSDTGAVGVGDVDGLAHGLSNLSPTALERLSNANIAFVSVPASADQAFPNGDLLKRRPRGWAPDKDWGDVPGGYFDFSGDQKLRSLLSPSGPWRVVVVGPQAGTSSYNVGLHETGHAWDNLNGANGRGASQLPEFQAAYGAEAPNLVTQAEAGAAAHPEHNDDYYYYLQGRVNGADMGAREAYAESFARYVADDPSLRNDWPSLYAYWHAQDQALGLRSTGSSRRP